MFDESNNSRNIELLLNTKYSKMAMLELDYHDQTESSYCG